MRPPVRRRDRTAVVAALISTALLLGGIWFGGGSAMLGALVVPGALVGVVAVVLALRS